MTAPAVQAWRLRPTARPETQAVALFGGLRLINGPLDLPEASVAWVSVVVGVHFVALAVVWANPFVRWPGGAITLCGAIGLLLAIAGVSRAPIAVVSGIVPGALLLATGWWYALAPVESWPPNARRSPSHGSGR